MRHHATILTAIWANPDFRALPHSTKGTYFMLLSQPKLSMCGVLDYMPSRWIGYDPDYTASDLERDIELLEAARFIVVDRAECELAIRTLPKHDPPKNPNSAIGMWNAWRQIGSTTIRQALVNEMPPIMWEGYRAPAEALEMSCRADLATVPEQLPQQLDDEPEVDPLPPTTIHLPPSTIHLPPPVTTRNGSGRPTTSTLGGGEEVAALIAERQLTKSTKRVHNQAGWLAKAAQRIQATHGVTIAAHIADGLTPTEIADLIEPAKPAYRGNPIDEDT